MNKKKLFGVLASAAMLLNATPLSVFAEEMVETTPTGTLTGVDPTNVGLTSTNFPDDNLLTAIKNQNPSATNASGVTQLSLDGNAITSLEGLGYLTKLETLSITNNDGITSLDLSNNGALTSIEVNGNNALSAITLPSTEDLKNLTVAGNPVLNTINLSVAPLLETVYLVGNSLDTLNLSGNVYITSLNVAGNDLYQLDATPCKQMSFLNVANNRLYELKVPTAIPTALNTLIAYGNKLQEFDGSGLKGLTKLDLSNNMLKSVNLSTTPDFSLLDLSYNHLAALNLKKINFGPDAEIHVSPQYLYANTPDKAVNIKDYDSSFDPDNATLANGKDFNENGVFDIPEVPGDASRAEFRDNNTSITITYNGDTVVSIAVALNGDTVNDVNYDLDPSLGGLGVAEIKALGMVTVKGKNNYRGVANIPTANINWVEEGGVTPPAPEKPAVDKEEVQMVGVLEDLTDDAVTLDLKPGVTAAGEDIENAAFEVKDLVGYGKLENGSTVRIVNWTPVEGSNNLKWTGEPGEPAGRSKESEATIPVWAAGEKLVSVWVTGTLVVSGSNVQTTTFPFTLGTPEAPMDANSIGQQTPAALEEGEPEPGPSDEATDLATATVEVTYTLGEDGKPVFTVKVNGEEVDPSNFTITADGEPDADGNLKVTVAPAEGNTDYTGSKEVTATPTTGEEPGDEATDLATATVEVTYTLGEDGKPVFTVKVNGEEVPEGDVTVTADGEPDATTGDLNVTVAAPEGSTKYTNSKDVVAKPASEEEGTELTADMVRVLYTVDDTSKIVAVALQINEGTKDAPKWVTVTDDATALASANIAFNNTTPPDQANIKSLGDITLPEGYTWPASGTLSGVGAVNQSAAETPLTNENTEITFVKKGEEYVPVKVVVTTKDASDNDVETELPVADFTIGTPTWGTADPTKGTVSPVSLASGTSITVDGATFTLKEEMDFVPAVLQDVNGNIQAFNFRVLYNVGADGAITYEIQFNPAATGVTDATNNTGTWTTIQSSTDETKAVFAAPTLAAGDTGTDLTITNADNLGAQYAFKADADGKAPTAMEEVPAIETYTLTAAMLSVTLNEDNTAIETVTAQANKDVKAKDIDPTAFDLGDVKTVSKSAVLTVKDADALFPYIAKKGDTFTVKLPDASDDNSGSQDPQKTPLTDATFAWTGSTPDLTYTGSPQTPAYTLTLDGNELSEGTDFEQSYTSNTNAGTATLTLTGKGNYEGDVTQEFTIKPKSISGGSITLQADTGATDSTPVITAVTVDGDTLTSGDDYTDNISELDTSATGDVTITVTGKGNYTGTLTKDYTVESAPISESGEMTEATQVAVPTSSYYNYNTSNTSAGSLKVYVIKADLMNRLYNPNSGEHFYTKDTHEKDVLVSLGWQYEGIGWVAPNSSQSSTPVYRLYNPNAGDHHYTMDVNERDTLVKVGWNYEGVGWYSAATDFQWSLDEITQFGGSIQVFREYNPNAKAAGAHNYTINEVENNVLVSIGWLDEGTAWWAIK